MKRVNPVAFIGVLLGLGLLLEPSRAARSQTFYSFGGSVNVARQMRVGRGHSSTSPGFAAQASVGRQLTPRSGWRVDLLVSQFDLTRPIWAGVMCAYNPPPGTCCGICPVDSSKALVGVAGLGASAFVSVIPWASGLGMYLTAGAETEYLYQHSWAQGAAQGASLFGVSAGAGVTVPTGGHRQAYVEARYHYLLGAPSQLMWLAPVTVGVRF